MHLNSVIKDIVFPSVPLGKLMNLCDFRQLPIIDENRTGSSNIRTLYLLHYQNRFISLPNGTDGKTMALIKEFKCILGHPNIVWCQRGGVSSEP